MRAATLFRDVKKIGHRSTSWHYVMAGLVPAIHVFVSV